MAQATSITVNDRETTPVAHTFVPRKGANGMDFVRAASVPIGNETISYKFRQSGGRLRTRISLAVPTLVSEVINSVTVPKVPRVAFISCDFIFDETSTVQERKNAVGMFYNLLASSQTLVDGALVNQDPIW